MVALVLQIIAVVAVSAFTLWLIGTIYLIVGSLIAISLFAILVGRGFSSDDSRLAIDRKDDLEGHELSLVALEFFYRLMLSILIGVFWPSLPVILWRGAVRDGAKHRDQSIER